MDVAPTILASLGFPIPAAFNGRNLLDGVQRSVYTESLHAHDAFGWAPLRALRAGRYKYIDAPRPELYDLAADPAESSNIIGTHTAEAQVLRKRLEMLLVRYAPGAPAPQRAQSPEAVSTLQSLGYLAHGPGIRVGSTGPDPKDRLGEFHLYEQAEALAADGQPQAEIVLLRRILARDPNNQLALRDLGSAYLELRRYAGARSTLEKVLRKAPDDYMTLYETGLADEHLGLRTESIAMLRRACHVAPAAEQCRHQLQTVEASKK